MLCYLLPLLLMLGASWLAYQYSKSKKLNDKVDKGEYNLLVSDRDTSKNQYLGLKRDYDLLSAEFNNYKVTNKKSEEDLYAEYKGLESKYNALKALEINWIGDAQKLSNEVDQYKIKLNELQLNLTSKEADISSYVTQLSSKPKEVFIDKIVEVEKIVEKRVEVPVEIIKEIEVIKEVFVDKIVEVEKIVENRIEVPVEIIKEIEVIKEVPVDRIVEVEKIV